MYSVFLESPPPLVHIGHSLKPGLGLVLELLGGVAEGIDHQNTPPNLVESSPLYYSRLQYVLRVYIPKIACFGAILQFTVICRGVSVTRSMRYENDYYTADVLRFSKACNTPR
jgi:hypothetical protein